MGNKTENTYERTPGMDRAWIFTLPSPGFRFYERFSACGVCRQRSRVLLFYDLDLQIVKINGVHEVVLIKPRLGMPFEFVDGGVKPDRLAQVEFIADLVKRIEDLVCAGVVCLVADDGIAQHFVVFEFFAPETEHDDQSFLLNMLILAQTDESV